MIKPTNIIAKKCVSQHQLQLRYCAIDELEPFPRNPRIHSARQVKQISASIKAEARPNGGNQPRTVLDSLAPSIQFISYCTHCQRKWSLDWRVLSLFGKPQPYLCGTALDTQHPNDIRCQRHPSDVHPLKKFLPCHHINSHLRARLYIPAWRRQTIRNNYERRIKYADYQIVLRGAELTATNAQGEHDLPPADDVRIGDTALVMRLAGGTIELSPMRFGFPPPRR